MSSCSTLHVGTGSRFKHGHVDAYPLNYNISIVNTTSTCGLERTDKWLDLLWQIMIFQLPAAMRSINLSWIFPRRVAGTTDAPFSLNVAGAAVVPVGCGLGGGHGASGMTWLGRMSYLLTFRMKLFAENAAPGGPPRWWILCCPQGLHNSDRRKRL